MPKSRSQFIAHSQTTVCSRNHKANDQRKTIHLERISTSVLNIKAPTKSKPTSLRRKDLKSLTYLTNSFNESKKLIPLKSCLSSQRHSNKLKMKVKFNLKKGDDQFRYATRTNSALDVNNNSRNIKEIVITNQQNEILHDNKIGFYRRGMAGDNECKQTDLNSKQQQSEKTETNNDINKSVLKTSLANKIKNMIVEKSKQLSNTSLRQRHVRKSIKLRASNSCSSINYDKFKERLHEIDMKNQSLDKDIAKNVSTPNNSLREIQENRQMPIKDSNFDSNILRNDHINTQKNYDARISPKTQNCQRENCKNIKTHLTSVVYQDIGVTERKIKQWKNRGKNKKRRLLSIRIVRALSSDNIKHYSKNHTMNRTVSESNTPKAKKIFLGKALDFLADCKPIREKNKQEYKIEKNPAREDFRELFKARTNKNRSTIVEQSTNNDIPNRYNLKFENIASRFSICAENFTCWEKLHEKEPKKLQFRFTNDGKQKSGNFILENQITKDKKQRTKININPEEEKTISSSAITKVWSNVLRKLSCSFIVNNHSNFEKYTDKSKPKEEETKISDIRSLNKSCTNLHKEHSKDRFSISANYNKCNVNKNARTQTNTQRSNKINNIKLSKEVAKTKNKSFVDRQPNWTSMEKLSDKRKKSINDITKKHQKQTNACNNNKQQQNLFVNKPRKEKKKKPKNFKTSNDRKSKLPLTLNKATKKKYFDNQSIPHETKKLPSNLLIAPKSCSELAVLHNKVLKHQLPDKLRKYLQVQNDEGLETNKEAKESRTKQFFYKKWWAKCIDKIKFTYSRHDEQHPEVISQKHKLLKRSEKKMSNTKKNNIKTKSYALHENKPSKSIGTTKPRQLFHAEKDSKIKYVTSQESWPFKEKEHILRDQNSKIDKVHQEQLHEHLFLTTSHLNDIKQKIISRCKKIRLKSKSLQEIKCPFPSNQNKNCWQKKQQYKCPQKRIKSEFFLEKHGKSNQLNDSQLSFISKYRKTQSECSQCECIFNQCNERGHMSYVKQLNDCTCLNVHKIKRTLIGYPVTGSKGNNKERSHHLFEKKNN